MSAKLNTTTDLGLPEGTKQMLYPSPYSCESVTVKVLVSVSTTPPVTRTGEVLIDKAIEAFLEFAEAEGYSTSEGASDNCNHASDEFLHELLAEVGIEGEIEHYGQSVEIDHVDYPYEMPYYVDFHWVVRVGDWLIDWTARQFEEEAPFPAVWKGERREWRNVT